MKHTPCSAVHTCVAYREDVLHCHEKAAEPEGSRPSGSAGKLRYSAKHAGGCHTGSPL